MTDFYDKEEFNRQAKRSMRDFLRSKTWEQKVDSIRRMNILNRTAKAAMRQSLAKQLDTMAPENSPPVHPGSAQPTPRKN